MRRRLARFAVSSPVALIAATSASGAAGYLITLLAGIELGPTSYLAFGVLWSSLFFTVGTLNGLQQEVARATHLSAEPSDDHVVRDVTATVAIVVVLVAMGTSVFWVPAIFGSQQLWLAIPLAVGLAGHTITTSLAGMLHGLRQSRLIAAAILLDTVLRFVLVIAVGATTHALGPISWALVLPYWVMPFIIWRVARERLRHSRVDVGRPLLAWQAASTLLASAATGSLVSGISVLVAAAGHDVAPAHVGAIVFAINITRAPLIIVVAAVQSLIVVRFRDRQDWRRLLVLLLLVVGGAGILLAVAAALGGPALIGVLLHRETLQPILLSVIVGSGGLVAMMTVTGSAVLARGRHWAYTAGWVVASAVTVIVLFAVPEFDVAVFIALLSGPLAGLLLHLIAIAIYSQAPPRAVSVPSVSDL